METENPIGGIGSERTSERDNFTDSTIAAALHFGHASFGAVEKEWGAVEKPVNSHSSHSIVTKPNLVSPPDQSSNNEPTITSFVPAPISQSTNVDNEWLGSLVNELITSAIAEASFTSPEDSNQEDEEEQSQSQGKLSKVDGSSLAAEETGEKFLQKARGRVYAAVGKFTPVAGKVMRIAAAALVLWTVGTMVRHAIFSPRPPVLRRAAAPSPFFPPITSSSPPTNQSQTAAPSSHSQHHHLTDLYTGDGASKLQLLSGAELTIVMLYSPWSLHSMEARRAFADTAAVFGELALNHHHDEEGEPSEKHASSNKSSSLMNGLLRFVAVNCYEPRGECRHRYKVLSYPVIFAYAPMQLELDPEVPFAAGIPPIVYNQPVTVDRLAAWVRHLLTPMRMIHTAAELAALQRTYSHIVLGYLPHTPGHHFASSPPSSKGKLTEKLVSHQFRVTLAAAYKAAASSNTIAFTHFQSPQLARELDFEADRDANLLRLYCNYCNHSIGDDAVMGEGDESDGGNTWVELRLLPKGRGRGARPDMGEANNSQQVVEWIQHAVDKWEPQRVDQLNLEEEEAGGKSETLAKQLNSTALTLVLFTVDLGLPQVSRAYGQMKQLARSLHDCRLVGNQEMEEKMPTTPPISEEAVESFDDFLYSARNACARLLHHSQQRPPTILRQQEEHYSDAAVEKTCEKKLEEEAVSSVSKKAPRASHRQNKAKKTFYQKSGIWLDRLSCQHYRLLRRGEPEALRAATASAERQAVVADHKTTSGVDDELSALAQLRGHSCRSNATVGLIVVDRRFSAHYQRKWLGREAVGDELLLVALRPDERIYVPTRLRDGPARFLLDYFQGRRAEAGNPKESGEGMEKEKEVHPVGMKSTQLPSSPIWRPHLPSTTISNLERLDPKLFVGRVLGQANSHDSVILFSGGRHSGASQVPAFVLHTVQRYFQRLQAPMLREEESGDQKPLIRFFLLDAGESSHPHLPWPYDLPSLPAVGFFPAAQPNRSSLLPAEVAITVPNLVGFIAARVQPSLRWHMALQLCGGGRCEGGGAGKRCMERNLKRVEKFAAGQGRKIGELRWLIRSTHYHRNHYAIRQFRAVIRRRKAERSAAMTLYSLLHDLRESKASCDKTALKKSSAQTAATPTTRQRFALSSSLYKWLIANEHRKRW